ncbi:hypothetical protein SUDANB171_00963 [Streptomyces sp. enrichment culture]|uniref:putative alpha/beta hydrolase n=1 Tax=Streptomyces sp. enrichment culture TaxID=1795815 RepID=UPI003F54F402
MSDISFTRQEVADEAGCDPWKERTDFQNETDAEEIFTLSSVFRNGSEVAEETGSVAQYASDLEERAGTRGSNAIYESAAEHLVQTHADLGGENLEVIARILGEVAEEVETVLEQNEEAITGDMGMNGEMDRQESDANSAFDSFETWLAAQEYGVGSSLEYTIYDCTFTSVYGKFPVDKVRDHVKKTHLDLLADFAKDVHEGITERIEDYYSLLYRKESELGDYGYSTVDSPLDFWFTPGRAEYEAEQLEIELRKEDPDPERLSRYTEGLARIAESVYGDPHNPQDPPNDLQDWQWRYLQTYYDTLSPEAFALLNGHTPDSAYPDGMAAVGDAERNGGFERAQIALANGVNMLMNPDLLGDNTRITGEDRSAVPSSISTFVYDHWDNPMDMDGDRLNEFNGFGEVMARATVAPGGAFSHDMANAAMDWLDISQLGFLGSDGVEVTNTGSNGLLQMVSLNSDASAEILTDEEFLDRMLDADWDDGTGAGNLIRSGTMPQDGELTDTQLEAAKNVILAAGAEPGGGRAAGMVLDLQSAVSDVGIYHLDSLVNTSDGDGDRKDIFGNTIDAFNISTADRESFYEFMARTEDSVQMSHIAGIQAYGYNEALRAFDAGDQTAIDLAMQRMGTVTGLFEREQLMYQHELTSDKDASALAVDKMWRTGAAVGISAVGAAATGGISTAATWTGMGNSVLQAMIPAPVPEAGDELTRKQYDIIFEEGRSMRHVFVQAAADADYGTARQDMKDNDIPDLHSVVPEELADRQDRGDFHEDLFRVENQNGGDLAWDPSDSKTKRQDLIQVGPFTRRED